MFGTYIYPIIVNLVTSILLLWLGTVLARKKFFNPRFKCIRKIWNNKTIILKSISNNVDCFDGILIFNGKSSYLDCRVQEFKLPIKISLQFRIGKNNESWATLLSWNQQDKPHNGIQIALVDNKIIGRIGNRLTGDIKSISEIQNDNEWHTLVLSRKDNLLVLTLDNQVTELIAGDQGIGDKRYRLYIGKSFFEEYFSGTIRNIVITNAL